MRVKTAIYLTGIPLACIWLFVQLTGFTWIVYAVLGCGIVIWGLIVINVSAESKGTPYKQYVAGHNARAAIERARVEEKARQAKILEDAQTALIDESDD